MKKGFWKRAASLGLAAALTLGLCACGGGEDGNGGGSGGFIGHGGSTKKDPNAALAKENVYKFDEFKMPDLNSDSVEVMYGSTVKDDRLYMILRTYNWSEQGGGEYFWLLNMKTDGSDSKVVELKKPDADENDSDAQMSTPAVLPMTKETPAINVMEGAAVEVMPVEPIENVWEDSYYNSHTLGSDGRVYAIKNYWYEDYRDPENYISINKSYVCCWNQDGTYAWETEIPQFQSEGEWVYVNRLLAGADGRVTILLSGDNAYTMDVSEGKVGDKKPMAKEISDVMSNVSDILFQSDGTALVLYHGEDWSKLLAATCDFATGKLGESIEMPASLEWSGYNCIRAGVSSDIVYSTAFGVYSLNLGDTESKQKMNFINSDLNVTNFIGLVELDENRFVGLFQENYDGGIKAGLFTYVKPEDIPDKGVLVLGGEYINNDMKQRVVEFNRNSEQYRIVLKNYNDYNTMEDYNAGLSKLNNDIITGQMPDILLCDGLPIENYIAKGVLADVGAMIAADPELSQVEYVQNVFDAYKVKGKLYQIIPNFNVTTIMGKKSIVGDRTEWTMADMKELMKSLPEGTEVMSELYRAYFFDTALQFCGSDFVDVETGKCEFNSPEFIELMEYAKSLPEQLDEDYYGEDYWMTYESRFRENKSILMQRGIYNIQGMNYVINGTFGEEVSFIGFPTAEGKGSYLTAYNTYAISARSLHLDGAWEFMRYYLTEDYQKNAGYGMSTIKSVFMEQAGEALGKPFYLDENGNKVEYDDYYYMNGEEIILEPMTREQMEKIVDFIFSVDKAYYYNNEIRNIINEDMEAFYSGQKSAQDVAAIIQSRAQIYVDENR